MSKITVKEIFERSEINRATFYKHYRDPFDLLEKIEDALLEQYQILVSNHGNYNLYNRIFADCYQQIFPLIGRKFSNLDNMKQNLLYYYISQGCSGAVSYWFTSGMKKAPEEIAEFISRATFSVAKEFSEEQIISKFHN